MVVEVYSMEMLDGSINEQCAEIWEHEFVSADDLRVYAEVLAEAATFMTFHGIGEKFTLDPARFSSDQPVG